MKTIQFIFVALFIGCIAATGQEMSITSKADNNAEVIWEKKAYDFGKLQRGNPAITYFTFTNTSNEAIVIEKVKTSCGCTASEYPKEPVLPGATASIKVTYDTKRAGAFSKSISVYLSNSNPVTMLKIKGSVL
jgi:hypothetical protein